MVGCKSGRLHRDRNPALSCIPSREKPMLGQGRCSHHLHRMSRPPPGAGKGVGFLRPAMFKLPPSHWCATKGRPFRRGMHREHQRLCYLPHAQLRDAGDAHQVYRPYDPYRQERRADSRLTGSFLWFVTRLKWRFLRHAGAFRNRVDEIGCEVLVNLFLATRP
jgi:hypothetical protein